MDSSCLSTKTPDTPEIDPIRPLRLWAKRLSQPLPEIVFCPGNELPEAIRHLLDHRRPMTSTLAKHHGARIALDVVTQTIEDHLVDRVVRLRTKSSEKTVVEAAALQIHVDALPVDARSAVFSGAEPLGTVLKSRAIAHQHRPQGFFTGRTNAWLADLLQLPAGSPIAGRCNVILSSQNELIAEIVECIPNPEPAAEA